MTHPQDNLPDDDDASLDLPADFKAKLRSMHASPSPTQAQWSAVDARISSAAAAHFGSQEQPAVIGRIGRITRVAAGLAALVAIAAALWFSSGGNAPDQGELTNNGEKNSPLLPPVVSIAVLPGDINRDGHVDILDAYLLQRRIESAATLEAAWDLTLDGQVDAQDVSVIAAESVKLDGGPRS